MNFLRIQKISVRCFDHQGMVVLSSQFSYPLVQYRHSSEVRKNVIERLSLYHSQHLAIIYEGIVTGCDSATFGYCAVETPRISLVAVNADD